MTSIIIVMMVQAHVFISGRVQRVFFRAWTVKEARNLGLTGFVRNLSDGRVEAVFEGPEERVEKMLKLCRRGPLFAKVENLEIVYEEATGEFTDFTVRR